MELIFNPFSITLILSGLVVGVLSAFIAYRMEDSTKWVAFTMLCSSIWGFFYGLELVAEDLEMILLLIKLQYLGISFLAVSWLFFAFQYARLDFKNYRISAFLFLLIPGLTFLFVLTDEFHGLMYQSYELVERGPFKAIQVEVGFWYRVHMLYSYLAFGVGNYILWKRFKFANSIFKAQTRLLFWGGLFPIVFNLLYQLSLFKPYGFIDLTPYAFLFSYILVGFAILKYNLFNIKPIATKKIIEAITKGVLVLDDNQIIIDFNPAIYRFIKDSEKIKVGNSIQAVFEESNEVLDFLNHPDQKILEVRKGTGEDLTVVCMELIPLMGQLGNSYGKVILFDDITEEVKTKETLIKQKNQLTQLNDLKDKYFSIISHDLKGPIFGIKELIHLTQTGLISKEEFFDILPEVSKNMENVSQLLENLLAWTSTQLRGEQMIIENFAIEKILRQQKQLLSRIANEKNIRVTLEENISGKMVNGDKTMIELVIRNLISNAIKFSNTGGEIQLSASETNQFVKICIEDFGKGISPENLDKINSGISFTTKGANNETGTGLGLVLVRDYIQKNLGKLEIISEENRGTKFCIYLPIGQSVPV